MLLDQREQHELSTVLASDLEDVYELLQDVGAGPHSQDTRTLVWTIFLPFLDACLAVVLAAVVTLHGALQDLEANATDQ